MPAVNEASQRSRGPRASQTSRRGAEDAQHKRRPGARASATWNRSGAVAMPHRKAARRTPLFGKHARCFWACCKWQAARPLQQRQPGVEGAAPGALLGERPANMSRGAASTWGWAKQHRRGLSFLLPSRMRAAAHAALHHDAR